MTLRFSRSQLLRPLRALPLPVTFLALTLLQQGAVGIKAQTESQEGPNGARTETSQSSRENRRQTPLPAENPVLASRDSSNQAARPSSANQAGARRGVPPPGNSPALKQSAADFLSHGNLGAAVQAYKQAMRLDPDDPELKLGLARALSLSGHNEESKGLYQQLLSKNPDNADALEGLGNAFLRSDHPSEARAVFERLAAKAPANPEYKIDLARVEARLGHYKQAQKILAAVLTFQPLQREATLQLAYIKLYQGRYASALADFAQVLKADPTDFDALLGNARAHYFRGEVDYSYALVSKLVNDHPDDYDAVFLLANLERARHHPRQALELLARADQLSPGNPECLQLEKALHQEQAVDLRTSASYAREISISNGTPDLIGFAGQDLRRFVYESALDFSALPRTRSTLALDAMPATSPGPFGGAVAPSQITYRQTTPVFSNFTLRAGAGLIRFGPGGLQTIPEQSQSVSVATYRPLGYVSATYAPKKDLDLDLTAARDPIPYTPLSVRMGVMESRVEGGLRYSFASHTYLSLSAYAADYYSISFLQLEVLNGNPDWVAGRTGREPSRGASATLVRNLLRLERASLDLGYSGRAFVFYGSQQQEYMGFFNPPFYQVHQAPAHLYGTLGGPLGYDFSGGLGVQQVNSHQPFTQALNLTPTLSLKLNRRLSLKLGYTQYNYAQSLGVIRGKGVILSTDSRF